MSSSRHVSNLDAPEVDLDYLQIVHGILRRRKMLVVSIFLLISLPLLGWSIYGQRPQFQSSAVVHIKPSIAEMVPGSRDLPVGPHLSVQMAVLKSWALAKQVVQSVPQETLDELISENLQPGFLESVSVAVGVLTGRPQAPMTPRQRALNELWSARMEFTSMDNDSKRASSGLVRISATAFKPQVAVDLVNTYVQILINWSRQSEEEDVTTVRSFLELQIGRVKKDLQEASATLTRFERQYGIIKGPSDESPVPSGARAGSSHTISARLAELEIALFQMQGKYTEDHPSVVATREEIRRLRNELARLPEGPRKASADEVEYARLQNSVQSNRALLTALTDKLLTLRVRAQGEGAVVKIIDPPNLPSSPVGAISPRRLAFLVAFALGAALGAGFLVEYTFEPIESENGIRQRVGLPLLGSALALPSRSPKDDGVPLLIFNHGRKTALPQEFYRKIRTNLEAANLRTPFKTIMFTSPWPGEGKSTTVLNMAMTLKELGRRVVLVDADLRNPSLSQLLPSKGGGGLSKLLQAPENAANATLPLNVSLEVMGVQPGSDFLFIPAGEATDDPGALLSSGRARELVAWLRRGWDYVLFDSPPILLVSDNVLFAKSMDGAILVAQAGQTRRRDLKRAKGLLEEAEVPVLGVILNQVPPSQIPYYYHKYRSYYGPYGSRGPGKSRDRRPKS